MERGRGVCCCTGIGSPPRPLKQEAGSAGWQVPVLEQSESLDLASDLDSAALPLLLPLHHSDTKFIGVADDQASCRNRASSPGAPLLCSSPLVPH